MKVRELTFALCAGLIAGAAAAQDAKPADKPMSAEQKAMMDAWAKFAMPGEGHKALAGITGYDNYKKKYIGTWQDNMSTAVMLSEGAIDAAGKVMASTSTTDDFMTGKKATIKMTTTFVSPDHHVFEMWGPGPDGKDAKQMEIVYKRRK